jgi:hypothetical protein
MTYVFSLSYIKLDNAIRVIQEFGSNSIRCKQDISNAFKQLPISSKQWHLFCFRWDNLYYNFLRLPFGCQSSPRLFDMLSRSIWWNAKSDYNISGFFFICWVIFRPTEYGGRTLTLLSLIFNKLNIPLSARKTVGHTSVL